MLKSGGNYSKQWVKIGILGPQITQIIESGLGQERNYPQITQITQIKEQELKGGLLGLRKVYWHPIAATRVHMLTMRKSISLQEHLQIGTVIPAKERHPRESGDLRTVSII